MDMKKELLRRVTVSLPEGERPEFVITNRTTFVVKGATLETPMSGDLNSYVLHVYGYRKQNPRGGWYNEQTFTNKTSLPRELHELFKAMMVA